jgi:hypothetical protein
VAADLSRLFRDIDIQRQIIKQIEGAGGEFWTVAMGRISHETAEQEFVANNLDSMNHYQRRYARDKSFLAVEIAIEQGKIPWSQTAPGYLRTDEGTLVPDPDLVDGIEEAFQMRADGGRIADVRDCLAQHGIVRSYHGTQHLLRDRIYIGEIHFGDHVPNLAAHEPIIDRELFRTVQRRKNPSGRRTKSDRLLARLGVLRCSSCGGLMIAGTQTQHGRRYPFYRCGHVRQDCSQRATISPEMVEELVVATIELALEDDFAIEADANARRAKLDLEEAQKACNKAIRNLADAEEEDEARTILAALREARDEAQSRVDRMPRGYVNASSWDELTFDQQRDLIRALIDCVLVKPGRGPERVSIDFF